MRSTSLVKSLLHLYNEGFHVSFRGFYHWSFFFVTVMFVGCFPGGLLRGACRGGLRLVRKWCGGGAEPRALLVENATGAKEKASRRARKGR